MNNQSDDPLDEIFVDENEPADKKILVEILKPFATIDSKGIIAYTDLYYNLKESKKALIYILCRKAMILKNIPGIVEKGNVKDVASGAGINESNAKNALFTFYKGIVQGGMIPNHQLRKVKEIIFQKDKKEGDGDGV